MPPSLKVLRWLTVLCLCMSSMGCGLVLFTGVAVGGTVAATVDTAGHALSSGNQAVHNTTGNMMSSVGRAIYKEGHYQNRYPTSLQVVWYAARNAFWDMNLKNIQGDFNSSVGHIAGYTHDKTRIDIRLRFVSTRETEITITVGVKGNESISSLVDSRIREHMSTLDGARLSDKGKWETF